MVFISGVKNTLCRNKIRAIYFGQIVSIFALNGLFIFTEGGNAIF